MPELVKLQSEAIKIDKVTVWENGSSNHGKTSTANFIFGMYNAVPPLQEIFNMAGNTIARIFKRKRNSR